MVNETNQVSGIRAKHFLIYSNASLSVFWEVLSVRLAGPLFCARVVKVELRYLNYDSWRFKILLAYCAQYLIRTYYVIVCPRLMMSW